MLTTDQIQQIDRALNEVGAFGEVRLIKDRGQLRFIQRLISEEAAGASTARPVIAAQPTFRPDRQGTA